MRRNVPILLILLAAAAGYLWWRSNRAATELPEASLLPLTAEEVTAGYTRATQPGQIRFPRDLGSHDEYQIEWWYYTGNLETSEGRPFGFQLTFFRRALSPPGRGPCSQADPAGTAAAADCPSPSAWRSNQVYLAHFTVSDLAEDEFYEAERFSRGAAGLAGAQSSPYRVWLEDWHARAESDGRVRLRAWSDDVSLDLLLEQTLPPILHGDGGLSPKGPEPGNASYYYSIVQQRTAGVIEIGNTAYQVAGLAWKDHEYSTSALSRDAVGWDWFSIQLDGGRP